jgi:hypothetical protein
MVGGELNVDAEFTVKVLLELVPNETLPASDNDPELPLIALKGIVLFRMAEPPMVGGALNVVVELIVKVSKEEFPNCPFPLHKKDPHVSLP